LEEKEKKRSLQSPPKYADIYGKRPSEERKEKAICSQPNALKEMYPRDCARVEYPGAPTLVPALKPAEAYSVGVTMHDVKGSSETDP